MPAHARRRQSSVPPPRGQVAGRAGTSELQARVPLERQPATRARLTRASCGARWRRPRRPVASDDVALYMARALVTNPVAEVPTYTPRRERLRMERAPYAACWARCPRPRYAPCSGPLPLGEGDGAAPATASSWQGRSTAGMQHSAAAPTDAGPAKTAHRRRGLSLMPVAERAHGSGPVEAQGFRESRWPSSRQPLAEGDESVQASHVQLE